MKLSTVTIALCISLTAAFAPQYVQRSALTQHNMFGGSGTGITEDNPEEMAKMEQAAKSMGMSLEEYQLGMKARERLTKQLDGARISSGNNQVEVERDANNPPKYLDIKITEAGKGLGKDGLSKELVSALKSASEKSRGTRQEAQKGMMQFISEEMKKMGKA